MMMKVKAAQFFVARAVERITSGRSVGRNNNNNNPKFQDREFVDWSFKNYFPIHTISVYVKSKNTTRFLFFNMNSKVIVTNMSTQVTYGTNQISFLLDSTISCILSLCFLSILLQSERKRFYYRKYPKLVCTQVEIISDPNYLVRILFERYVIFKAPNLVRTSYFSGNLEEAKLLELR